MNTAEQILGTLCGLVLLAQAIWLGIALHIGYTKMDLMLSHLKNSPLIVALAPIRFGGVWGTLMVVGGISSVVTFPNFYLKRRHVDEEDIRRFPRSLKRRLAVFQWNILCLLGAMTVFAIIIKSEVLK